MIPFRLDKSDFKQDLRGTDDYELRSVFNLEQVEMIISAVNNHPKNSYEDEQNINDVPQGDT